jgi:ubiquinone/menaquinone biosynthesis C-methylase UbiE
MTETPNTQHHEGYALDAENAAEMARLMVQDQVLTQAMGGVLPEQTDLSHLSHALDIGCGPGGWILSLTQEYSHIQGVGIDISHLMIEYANRLATLRGLSNARFEVMDATKPLDFPDHHFDLVNGRILVGFLSKAQWPTLVQECARITRPGGMLRFTEAEWGFTNSPAFDTLSGFIGLAAYRAGHSFSPHGRTVGNATMLRFFLQRAGYQDIACQAHVVDYSAGTELHEGNVQDHLVFHKLIQPFFVQMQVATQEELESLYAQMEQEVQAPDFCALDFYLTVWGNKRDPFS